MYELIVLGKEPRITRAHKNKLELMVTSNPQGRRNVAATKARLRAEGQAHIHDCQQNADELVDAQAAVRDVLVKRNPNARNHPYFWAANKRDNCRVAVSMSM
jgi:hypothetical protein